MMKPRNSRPMGEAPSARVKSEPMTTNGGTTGQQTSAQAIRKRRSSINVYDQPSSLNARLRQLETDMLRLDEDRTKLFDDTHTSLAQFEIRLNEIQSILKSRQDNVEKYVEEMKLLLAAKEEFEKQARALSEKHERMQDKFMHRETTISREIKLLKTKFELLEKNKQFRYIFQSKSNDKEGDSGSIKDATNALDGSGVPIDPNLRKDRDSSIGQAPHGSEGHGNSIYGDPGGLRREGGTKNSFLKRLFMFCNPLKALISPLVSRNIAVPRKVSSFRRKSNRVSSLISVTKPDEPVKPDEHQNDEVVK